jgi:two-component system phosphate regulon response regulator PhoB
MSQTILLVEDEQDLSQILSFHLRKEGFQVVVADTGAVALSALDRENVDLVLLDVMLPDMSGVDICRNIREGKHSSIPVIMVTAKGEEQDRVSGFEVGADDYVVKPFSSKELILRIRAILRRPREMTQGTVLEYDLFTIDQAAHKVWVAGEEILLTSLEFKLLTQLVQHKGMVQTREILLEKVWELDPNINTRTVDKHVQRLRNKLNSGAEYIETIRGVGYRLQKPT